MLTDHPYLKNTQQQYQDQPQSQFSNDNNTNLQNYKTPQWQYQQQQNQYHPNYNQPFPQPQLQESQASQYEEPYFEKHPQPYYQKPLLNYYVHPERIRTTPPYRQNPPTYWQPQNISIPFEQAKYRPLMSQSVLLEQLKIQNFRENPFKQDGEIDAFKKGFANMASYEKLVEDARLKLAFQDDFRLGDLFSKFDLNMTNNLIAEEIQIGLQQFDLLPELADIELLFKEYGNNGNMDFSLFASMIYPITPNIKTKCNNEDPQRMVPETKLYIRKLFIELLNSELEIESFRQEIREFKDYDLEKAYQDIFVTENHSDCLKNYLYSTGIYVDSVTVEGILRKFDRNGTSRITEEEFIYTLTPRLNM